MATLSEPSLAIDSMTSVRTRITFWIAAAGFVTLAPLAAYHLMAGHFALGLASSGVLVSLGVLANSTRLGHESRLTPLIVPGIVLLLGFSVWQQGVIGLFWSFPAIVVFHFVLTQRWAIIANIVAITTVVTLAGQKVEAAVLMRGFLTLAGVSLFTGLVTQLAASQHDRLRRLLMTDELTGLENRTMMHTRIEQVLRDYEVSGTPSSLVTFDVDRAHLVNRTRGYKHRDLVLAGIAETLRRNLRDTDGIFRTGGEEFTVLLLETNRRTAITVAERVRNAIATDELVDDDQIIVTAGIVAMRDGDSAESWIDRADRFLYEAKRRATQGHSDPFVLTQPPQPQPAPEPFGGEERRNGPQQANPFAVENGQRLTAALARKATKAPKLEIVKAS